MSSLIDDTKTSHVAAPRNPEDDHPFVGAGAPETFTLPICGVPTSITLVAHSNQLTVMVTQTGGFGTVLVAEPDAGVGAPAEPNMTYSIKVTLGPRDSDSDSAVALCRRSISSLTAMLAGGARPCKRLLLMLGSKGGPLSHEAAKEIYTTLCGALGW